MPNHALIEPGDTDVIPPVNDPYSDAVAALTAYWVDRAVPCNPDLAAGQAARVLATAGLLAVTLPAADPVVWEVRLPWNKPPLSLNDRRQWAEHSRVRREVRDAARWAIRAAKLGGPYELVEVCLHWRPARNHRRDDDNPVATAKVCYDACVDEGLCTDDTPRYMRKLMPEIHPAVPGQGAAVWLSVAVVR